MCTPKPPKIKQSDPVAKTPDPAIIRNPYLDDFTDFSRNRTGRSQLRINPGTPRGVRIPLPSSAQPRSGPSAPAPTSGNSPIPGDPLNSLARIAAGHLGFRNT